MQHYAWAVHICCSLPLTHGEAGSPRPVQPCSCPGSFLCSQGLHIAPLPSRLPWWLRRLPLPLQPCSGHLVFSCPYCPLLSEACVILSLCLFPGGCPAVPSAATFVHSCSSGHRGFNLALQLVSPTWPRCPEVLDSSYLPATLGLVPRPVFTTSPLSVCRLSAQTWQLSSTPLLTPSPPLSRSPFGI